MLSSRAETCKRNILKGNVDKSKFFKNCRQPGQFPFELLRYMLDKPRILKLKLNSLDPNFDKEKSVEDELLVSHFISDLKTGLMKEIMSIVNMRLAHITKDGSVVLNDGWEMNVPNFVLHDMMNSGWGSEIDTKNKFGLHSILREKLNSSWTRLPGGWAHRSNPCKMIHSDSEYENRKEAFEDKFEEQMNEIDGIAQFGI